MFYVYILQSLKYSKQIYAGSAKDLKTRIMKHNNGEVFSTKRYMPWELIYYEAYTSEHLARAREKQLKHHGNAMGYLKKRIFGEPISKMVLGEKGQTLVLLLIYVIVAMIITSTAVAIAVVNSRGTDKVYQGITAYDVAESGVETAMLKLLRDPNYSGETLTVNGGTATITISGTTIKTITSRGTLGNFTRTVQVTADASNNTLTVTSWKEI